MHPNDIAIGLSSHDNYDTNLLASDRIGWERTKGQMISKDGAEKMKEIVERRTRTMLDYSTCHRLLDSVDDDASVHLWNHSQIKLGNKLGEGGFNQVYKIKSMPTMKEESTTRTTTTLPGPGTQPKKEQQNKRRNRLQGKDGTNNRYVVKVLRKEIVKNENEFAICAADIVKEALLMAALDHPNIVKTRGMASTGIGGFQATRRPDAFFIVMETLKGSLEDRIRAWQFKSIRHKLKIRGKVKKQTSFLRDRLNVAGQVADAIRYMHSFNLLHRDIKVSNIGFDLNGTVKVFDFDMARFLPEALPPNELFLLTAKAGSMRYMSPECWKGQPYNLKTDVYSFSMLLYHVVSLKEPYADMDAKQQIEEVFEGGFRPKIPSSVPTGVQNVLQQSWARDINTRPTMEEVKTILKREVDALSL